MKVEHLFQVVVAEIAFHEYAFGTTSDVFEE